MKELILYIWRRALKRRVAEVEPQMSTEAGRADTALRAESYRLRMDLKALNRWPTGEAIIKVLK